MGKNGSGKTNILEGLSLLEKGKGFKKEKINNLINYYSDTSEFNIESVFCDDKINLNIKVFNTKENLKRLSVNNSLDKESISHFESLFSIIYFLPEMERLFLSSPSLRRNFLDRLIYNIDKSYNTIINKYKKILLERQSLLKSISYDESWMAKLEIDITELALLIYNKRINHIDRINKILKEITFKKKKYSNFILKTKDIFLQKNPNILDNSELYLTELKKNRKQDFILGGCPIILLDEVCSHLDVTNRELLLYLIDELKAQVFMTGTEENFFSFLSTKANYCNIN